jgi:hypothetical protein
VPARDVFGYVTDIDDLLISNFAQEFQRQMYRFGSHPLDVTFLKIGFASQLISQIAQALSDLFVNIYRYKASHFAVDPLKPRHVPQHFQSFVYIGSVRGS